MIIHFGSSEGADSPEPSLLVHTQNLDAENFRPQGPLDTSAHVLRICDKNQTLRRWQILNVNWENFAIVLFSRNFAYAKLLYFRIYSNLLRS